MEVDEITDPKEIEMENTDIKDKNQFPCNVCEKSFPILSLLVKHVMIHTGEKPHSCEICKEVFSSKIDYKAHRKTHLANSYDCDICGKSFKFQKYLNKHKKLHNSEKAIICDICGKSFTVQRYMARHKKEAHGHVNEYSCDKCKESFTTRNKLLSHMKTHDTGNIYDCKECGKEFSSLMYLKAHQKRHLGKKFVCNVCGKALTTKDNLSRHILSNVCEKVGKVENIKNPFLCNICGMTFSESNGLMEHRKIIHDKKRETTQRQKKEDIDPKSNESSNHVKKEINDIQIYPDIEIKEEMEFEKDDIINEIDLNTDENTYESYTPLEALDLIRECNLTKKAYLYIK